MITNKFAALEAFMSAQGITKSELMDWINGRGTEVIPTELPLVYRRGNKLTVENGLNLSRRSELWGIQLLSGVMVALKCGPGNNVSSPTWENVKSFAEKMRFEGMPCFLPSKNALKEHWGNEEEAKFVATVDVLEKNEIEADGYWGTFWCSGEFSPNYAYYFILENGSNGWYYKYSTNYYDRVALAFN